MAGAAVFVVDSSVAIGWLFEEQADKYTETALDALTEFHAVAPRWLGVEITNVLLVLERRRRLTAAQSSALLQHLQRLPVRLSDSVPALFELHSLAVRHQLTSYDALYLQAALVTGLPLATRDRALRKAARQCGLGTWGA